MACLVWNPHSRYGRPTLRNDRTNSAVLPAVPAGTTGAPGARWRIVEDFLRQVEAAATALMCYLALFASLALPDLCAAVEAEDAETNGSRYIDSSRSQPSSRTAFGDSAFRDPAGNLIPIQGLSSGVAN
jgi:hypothetical protein